VSVSRGISNCHTITPAQRGISNCRTSSRAVTPVETEHVSSVPTSNLRATTIRSSVKGSHAKLSAAKVELVIPSPMQHLLIKVNSRQQVQGRFQKRSPNKQQKKLQHPS
ncbi:unnamed protein product, partial [Candidula unifasciata]